MLVKTTWRGIEKRSSLSSQNQGNGYLFSSHLFCAYLEFRSSERGVSGSFTLSILACPQPLLNFGTLGTLGTGENLL